MNEYREPSDWQKLLMWLGAAATLGVICWIISIVASPR